MNFSESPNDHLRHLSCTQKFPLGKTSDDDWKPTLNNSESTGTMILPVSNIKFVRFSIGISLKEKENEILEFIKYEIYLLKSSGCRINYWLGLIRRRMN